MALKFIRVALLSLALGSLAGAAQAIDYSLVGGGGQLHIGGGLALPIQAAIPQNTVTPSTGTVFPPLLIPVRIGPAPIVSGTVVKPLIDVGTKKGYQRKLRVPAGVLKKTAAQTTVGLKFSNLALFAAATNLTYEWPAVPATFSTKNAVATTTITGFGGSLTYSNSLGQRFGGAAQFALSPGPAAGNYANAPVTLYIKINGTTPACTHTNALFGGTDPGCVAGMVLVKPTGLAGHGGASTRTEMTPGAVATPPNVAIVKMGLSPLGTMLPGLAPPANVKPYPVRAAAATLPTNMATSQAGPWTTGKIIITNMSAQPTAETFTISGKDDRTAGGGGTIQMVAGSLSQRATTGPNGNRAWVRLELQPVFGVPSMSRLGLAATAGLLLLTAGYALRRRIFA
jgi:hypothetical protein